jgi:hypothetical protein
VELTAGSIRQYTSNFLIILSNRIPIKTVTVAIWDIIIGKTDDMIDLNGSLTQDVQQITYNPIPISSDCYMGFGIRL